MVKKIISIVILVACCVNSFAQQRSGSVDIFMGVDLNYRDIYFNGRVFDFLIHLTPGVKWYPGQGWEVSAQAYIPVVNQYGHDYKYVRLRNAAVSKQFAVGNRFKMKLSGGLFDRDAYGLDFKGLFIINKWLALTGQVGFSGFWMMAPKVEFGNMTELTFQLGPEFYITRYNTGFWIRGGRYLYGDYGFRAEAFRHFKHVSVGVYATYSDKLKEDAGFKVVVMLPPYKRKDRTVNFRPASNFRLTYSTQARPYANKMYNTDPEENERSGWFDHELLPWGQSTMPADFEVKENKKEDEK